MGARSKKEKVSIFSVVVECLMLAFSITFEAYRVSL